MKNNKLNKYICSLYSIVSIVQMSLAPHAQAAQGATLLKPLSTEAIRVVAERAAQNEIRSLQEEVIDADSEATEASANSSEATPSMAKNATISATAQTPANQLRHAKFAAQREQALKIHKAINAGIISKQDLLQETVVPGAISATNPAQLSEDFVSMRQQLMALAATSADHQTPEVLEKTQAITDATTYTAAATTVRRYRYDYRSYWSSSSDYRNNMNSKVYSYYAPYGTKNIQVDFSYIDVESGFDYVELYDRYGLCASYTGHYPAFTSATCDGNYVDVWIYSDSKYSGDVYSGFKISGFYYAVDTYVPVASFSYSPNTPAINDTITFDGTWTYDYDTYRSQLQFCWNFGDYTKTCRYGNSGAAAAHAYAKPGKYWVTLTVTDPDNNVSYYDALVTVLDAKPKTDLTLKAEIVSKINAVRLYIKKSVSSGAINKLNLNWGDGSTVETIDTKSLNLLNSGDYISLTHYYGTAGNSVISVNATNSRGTITKTTTVTISDTAVAPLVRMTDASKKAFDQNQGKGYTFAGKFQFWDDGKILNTTFSPGVDSPIEKMATVNDGYLMSAFRYDYGVTNPNNQIKNRCDKATGKNCLAGVYNIVVSATDNEGASGSVNLVEKTKNFAPVAIEGTKYIAMKAYPGTIRDQRFAINPIKFARLANNYYKNRWTFVYGRNNAKGGFDGAETLIDSPNTLFVDYDGSVAASYWEFLMADKITQVPGCGRVDSLIAQCEFLSPHAQYIARFIVIDNLGKARVLHKRVITPSDMKSVKVVSQ